MEGREARWAVEVWVVRRVVGATATAAAAKAEAVTEAAKVAAEPALCLEARGRGWAVVVWAALRAAEAPVREATTAAAGAGWVLGRWSACGRA